MKSTRKSKNWRRSAVPFPPVDANCPPFRRNAFPARLDAFSARGVVKFHAAGSRSYHGRPGP